MSLLPVWFKGLTPELGKLAEETIGETPQVREKGLVDLKRLLNDRTDIFSRQDDVFLLRFLRTKKYNVPKSFQLLLNYYAFRSKHDGSFTGMKPSGMKKVIDMQSILYSPYRMPQGSHVAVYRIGAFDVNRATAQDLITTVLMVGEMILDCEATQVCGGIIVIDMKGMTMQHYTQFLTTSFVSFIISVVHDCLPERLKAVHFVNTPFIFNTIFKVVKPLLKKKLRERIQVHEQNLKSLHAAVPKDFLPVELGGHLSSLDNREFASYFFSQESFIESINKYGFVQKTKDAE